MSVGVIRVAIDAPEFVGYCRLRRTLWPMDEMVNEREASTIVNDPARWSVFVAHINAAIVGFVEVHLREYAEGASTTPVGFLEGWFVVPEVRREGVGGALVRAAEQWARERGCIEMGSDTEVDNAVSIEAHQRLGYGITERLVAFLKRL